MTHGFILRTIAWLSKSPWTREYPPLLAPLLFLLFISTAFPCSLPCGMWRVMCWLHTRIHPADYHLALQSRHGRVSTPPLRPLFSPLSTFLVLKFCAGTATTRSRRAMAR